MEPLARQHAAAIDAVRRGLSDVAVDAQFAADPAMEARYGQDARRVWRPEAMSRLEHLSEALACGSPAMFAAHVHWAASALRVRDVPQGDVRTHIEALERTLAAELPPDAAARVRPFMEAANAAVREPCAHGHGLLEERGPDATLARRYLLHLMQREMDAAERVAVDALGSGMKLAEVYERVLAPALGEVGRMWHMQEASIADEHYCTASTRSIVNRLRGAVKAPPADGRRALCCAVSGDMHDLVLRMVADLLELDGWAVEFLGADVPSTVAVMSVEQAAEEPGRAFHLVCIGARTQLSARSAMDMIESLRSSPVARGVKVILGGGPFSADPGLALRAGADAGVRSLSEAVAAAARLVPAAPRHP